MRALVVAVVVVLTGCIPGLDGNQGWPQARTPNRTPVTIGDVPYLADDFHATGPWMGIAGWALFAPPVPGTTPQISFAQMSPICRYGITNPCDRTAAWVQRSLNPDGSIAWVVIHYDPAFESKLTPSTFQHEIGHAMGLAGDMGCDNPYRGVMSYCGWVLGSPGPNWFGSDDVQMVTNVGYR